MASTSYRIKKRKNSEEASIYVIFSAGRGKQFELKTGFSINESDWNEKTNFPINKNHPKSKNLISNLQKLISFLSENYNKDIGSSTIIDKYWFESKINECFGRVEKNNNGLLISHIQFIIDNSSTRKVQGRNKIGISKSRVKGYSTFKSLMETYQKSIKKQIHFLDINKGFVTKLTNWLLNEKGYSVNYSGKVIDNLKTVCIDAAVNEIEVNPYVNKIAGFSENDEDRYIITLSFDELNQILDTEIKNQSFNNAKKWLLIGCEVGQRAGDLLNITKEDFRYKSGRLYLDIVQQKTGKSVTIGIIAPHVIDIIENDFPYKISTQKLNEYIKKVCEISNLKDLVQGKKINPKTKRKELDFYPKHELITTHSFRRSFATNYYKKIPTAILMAITGHSKESIFLNYINKREDKDANAELFMKFYEDMNKEKEPQLKKVL